MLYRRWTEFNDYLVALLSRVFDPNGWHRGLRGRCDRVVTLRRIFYRTDRTRDLVDAKVWAVYVPARSAAEARRDWRMATMLTRNLCRVAVTSAVCAISLVGVGVSTASAGEITGNGKFKPVVAHSICAYSGQNDAFHDPTYADFPGDELIRVQSYGQIIRTGERLPAFLHPGSSCNGHSGFLASGPSEP